MLCPKKRCHRSASEHLPLHFYKLSGTEPMTSSNSPISPFRPLNSSLKTQKNLRRRRISGQIIGLYWPPTESEEPTTLSTYNMDLSWFSNAILGGGGFWVNWGQHKTTQKPFLVRSTYEGSMLGAYMFDPRPSWKNPSNKMEKSKWCR